jgi:hypothetical protein
MFLDGFLAMWFQLQQMTGGISQEAMKQLLSQGYSSCLVVPLLAASVDLGSTSASASASLRDNIELDCRGRLSYQNDGRYLLEFAEIKSSLGGKNCMEVWNGVDVRNGVEDKRSYDTFK